MGPLGITLCAGVAALAATLTPTAYAANPAGGVSVTPSTPAPGDEVVLEATGCPGERATARSRAFVSDARLVGPGGPGGPGGPLSGETRIRTSLAPGSHPVTIVCADAGAGAGAGADAEVEGTIEVVAVAARPTAPASPVAPVQAGGGGAAPLAAADDSRVEGPGLAHTLTGLLLAGAAAVAVVLRGARRSRRGTE
ncbi:hypothetical protein ACIRPQ_03480 [Streptomyces sp. NPDC101213]|uniref:hypothetical protein n=1 Tax=Streptomyces sp. NPDC101213 TaxID=3366130 RepID=UPI003817F674